MKLFGSLTELVTLIFRKNSQTITVRPSAATTYTAARIIDLPAQDANSQLISTDSTDTLTNKSISGSTNTITNIPLATAISGILPTANGGTGQNSTATFPASGIIAAVPSAGIVRSNGTVLSSGTVALGSEVTGLLSPTLGGTGVSNTATFTVGPDNVALATTGASSVTLPTSGTLATLAGAETLSNKTLLSPSLSSAQLSNYLDAYYIATPGSPTGAVRLYSKSDNKLYKINPSGIESEIGSGSGSGSKNYIADRDVAGITWVASGAGVTVATTTTAADLPEASKGTGIRITAVSGTDYVRTRFTMDAGDASRPGWISTYIKTLTGYTAGDFKFELFSNAASNYSGAYTAISVLPSDIAVSSSGAFIVHQFVFSTASFLELRVTRVAGTASLVLSGVSVGPSTLASNVIITPWQRYTPVWTGFGTVPAEFFEWRRVGSEMEIRGDFASGLPTATPGSISLPTGYNIDTTVISATNQNLLGTYHNRSVIGNDIFVGTGTGGWIHVQPTTNAVFFTYGVGANVYQTQNVNGVITNGDNLDVAISVPIAEWASSGTSALGTPGETIETAISYLTFPNNTDENIATFALTPGVWDIDGQVKHGRADGGSRAIAFQQISLNTTSAVHNPNLNYQNTQDYGYATSVEAITLAIPPRRITLSATTTMYLVLKIVYSLANTNVSGYITAKRVS